MSHVQMNAHYKKGEYNVTKVTEYASLHCHSFPLFFQQPTTHIQKLPSLIYQSPDLSHDVSLLPQYHVTAKSISV